MDDQKNTEEKVNKKFDIKNAKVKHEYAPGVCSIDHKPTPIKNYSEMIGGMILDIGMLENYPDEGGFAIDYLKNGKRKRFVLGFTDLGEWTAFHG
jgi:hypothetical protein